MSYVPETLRISGPPCAVQAVHIPSDVEHSGPDLRSSSDARARAGQREDQGDTTGSRIGEEAKARVGQTLLGKWRLDELLGIGGFAAVYAATHRNGMRGAVKLLHPQKVDDDEIRSRFLREGYIANRVQHDGAVRILDDDVDEQGNAFLVMELLRGEDLQERASTRGGRLSPREVMEAAYDLLGILSAAHAEGIVHRDIKPENLFRTTDGRVKVLDFGIAHLAEAPRGARTTGAGIALGTPAFMSPEQARGRRELVGPASDLWSVGATMFNLLSGELVHAESTLPELLAATFTKRARSLRNALPSAPAPLVAVVDRALAFHPEERWPSALAMREALADAYRQITGEPITLSCARSVTPAGDLPTGPRSIARRAQRTPGFHDVTTAQDVAPRPRARRWALASAVVLASVAAGLALLTSHATSAAQPTAAVLAAPANLAPLEDLERLAAAPRADAPACEPTPPVACAPTAPPAEVGHGATVRPRAGRVTSASLWERRF